MCLPVVGDVMSKCPKLIRLVAWVTNAATGTMLARAGVISVPSPICLQAAFLNIAHYCAYWSEYSTENAKWLQWVGLAVKSAGPDALLATKCTRVRAASFISKHWVLSEAGTIWQRGGVGIG